MPRRTQVAPRLREGYVVACTKRRECAWSGWRRAERRNQAEYDPCPQCGHAVGVVHYAWRAGHRRRRR